MKQASPLNRRSFLKTLGATAASAAAIPALMSSAAEKEDGLKPSPVSGDMPRRGFGKTGVKVPILSLGGIVDFPNNQLLLRQALRWGVSYWDTADCYNGGRSEEGLGKFFRDNPTARKEIFLVSKSDKRDPEGMSKLLDQSLRRMGVPSLDLYFLHGVKDVSKEITDATKQWVENAKKQGKIKFFGFSTHSNMAGCLQDASKLGWIDGIMLTYNYRIMHEDAMRAAVDAAHRAGIGLTAMKTQGGGPIKSDSEAELKLAGRFMQQGFTEGQARLLAVWEDERISAICSQMPSINLLMTNIAAALKRVKLDPADIALLREHAEATSHCYCAGCTQHCEPATGDTIAIGAIMRALMYDEYGDRAYAQHTFDALPEKMRNDLAHFDFEAAERACPRNLPIAALAREAVSRFA